MCAIGSKHGVCISHRIHGAAIYGNMDPINIPPMLAYIPAPWIRHGYVSIWSTWSSRQYQDSSNSSYTNPSETGLMTVSPRTGYEAFDHDTYGKNLIHVPSGELTFCHGKIHHAITGKIHYFYGHFPLLFVSSPEGNKGEPNLNPTFHVEMFTSTSCFI